MRTEETMSDNQLGWRMVALCILFRPGSRDRVLESLQRVGPWQRVRTPSRYLVQTFTSLLALTSLFRNVSIIAC